jgi:hypothetical protein
MYSNIFIIDHYKVQFFTEMLFNDPNDHKSDIRDRVVVPLFVLWERGRREMVKSDIG